MQQQSEALRGLRKGPTSRPAAWLGYGGVASVRGSAPR